MKIAICTPHNGEMKAAFAVSMTRLILHSGHRHEFEIFDARGSSIAWNRREIAEHALRWGADYLLWLDTDHVFPPDALERLLAHDRDVVGCNQPRRRWGQPPTAVIVGNDGKLRYVMTTKAEADARILQQVHGLGLALCLMKSDVFRRMERPWFEAWPGGEDNYFYAKLSKLKIPAFVDHALSWETGHIGEHVFTNADTVVADEDRWTPSEGIASS